MHKALCLLIVGLPLVGAPLAGCPSLLAPPATDGAAQGAACASDWQCASGLSCECGVCATVTENDRPPACNIDVGDACDDTPSSCFAACGDLSVVGVAACVEGRESCADTGGLLASQCAEDTCWGEPEIGQSCFDGEFVCDFGAASSGACYTFDCPADEQSECVTACGDQNPQSQVCVASEWVCETGTDIVECGDCTGVAPGCVRSCDDLQPIGTAVCDQTDLVWGCPHIQVDGGTALTDLQCCSPPTTVRDVADLTQLDGINCVAGTLSILTGTVTDVQLPYLETVTDLQITSNNLQTARFPSLRQVTRVLNVESNPALREFSAPVLTRVGTGLFFLDNPKLCTCDLLELRERIADAGLPAVDFISANLECFGWPDDAGPNPDAGLPFCEEADGGSVDAGFLDAGFLDAGSLDAGSLDGGPVDAGFVDAGQTDGGTVDSGAVDAGPLDSGAVDSGAADAGVSDAGQTDAGAVDAGADGG